MLCFSHQSATLTLCPSSLTCQLQPAPARRGSVQDSYLTSSACCPTSLSCTEVTFELPTWVISAAHGCNMVLPGCQTTVTHVERAFLSFTLAWRVARVPFGLMDSSLSACGKLFPKGMQASFSRGDYLSLPLAEPIRESGYEVSPRNNPAGVQ